MQSHLESDFALAMALAEAEQEDEENDDFQHPIRSGTLSQIAILKEHNGVSVKGKMTNKRPRKVGKAGKSEFGSRLSSKENRNDSCNGSEKSCLREEDSPRLALTCPSSAALDSRTDISLTQRSMFQESVQNCGLMRSYIKLGPTAFHLEKDKEMQTDQRIPNHSAENEEVRDAGLDRYKEQSMPGVAAGLGYTCIQMDVSADKLDGRNGQGTPVADSSIRPDLSADILDGHTAQKAPHLDINIDITRNDMDLVADTPCSQIIVQDATDCDLNLDIVKNEMDHVGHVPCSRIVMDDKLNGEKLQDTHDFFSSLNIGKNETDLVLHVPCSQIVNDDKMAWHYPQVAPDLVTGLVITTNEIDLISDIPRLQNLKDNKLVNQKEPFAPNLATIIGTIRNEANLVTEFQCSEKDALSTIDFCQVDAYSRKDALPLAIANLGNSGVSDSQKDAIMTSDLNFDSQLEALLSLCSSDMSEEILPRENEFTVDIKHSLNSSMEKGFDTDLFPEIEDKDVMAIMTQITDISNSKELPSHCDENQTFPTERENEMMTELNKIVGENVVVKDADHQINLDVEILELWTGHAFCQRGNDIAGYASIKDKDYHENKASDLIVQCPVCGIQITGMSHEQRELHTNKCLDDFDQHKEKTAGTTGLNEEGADVSCINILPVLKWLENLGLSKYATVFVKEEIDWDTLKWLTENDLNALGITALGPRRKIAQALEVLKRDPSFVDPLSRNNEEQTNNSNHAATSCKMLITDFFPSPQGASRSTAANSSLNSSSTRVKKAHINVARSKKRTAIHHRGIPKWMTIPGSKFRVDAFQYLRGDCMHWFLTHFHTDHYQGLTRSFRYGNIYCSSVTAQLVHLRIGVSWDYIRPLPLNERINIDGCDVTFIDANHCPGSVMILFEFPSGQVVLHTGDFRFCEEMRCNPVLHTRNVHTLVLDTTYCNPQYDFPKQDVVIQFIIDAIQAEAFNQSTLFLIGTYTIGKERIFLEVAQVLQKKIYIGTSKLRLLECMDFKKEDMKWMTVNEEESHIHVVPLWTIASFKRMKFVSQQYSGKYNSIIAFSPTGWSYGRGKKRTCGHRWQQGTIIRYEVPYSEHCSFKELQEFVSFLSPKDILPSVHNDSPETADAMVALLLDEKQNSDS